jgi:hypothetical protein
VTDASEDTRARIGRIFIGVWEISNMVFTMGEALREAGYEVETFVIDTPFGGYYRSNPYDDRITWPSGDRIYRAPVDRGRFDLRMARKGLAAARRCDTFVFVWRYSFLPFQLDLPLLRLLGKRVILFWCGNDVCYKPIQVALEAGLEQPWFPTEPAEQRRWLSRGRTFAEAFWTTKLGEKTGCSIVASRDSTTFQGKRYSNFFLPQRMLIERPREPAEHPLIVHAPSDPDVKGTRYVEQAIARLTEEELEFEFKLLRDVTNEELHDWLKRADIVIDCPGTWVARFGLESMASGAVVVGGNQPSDLEMPRSPVQVFEQDADHLTATIRRLITDREERARLMRESYEYVKHAHSYAAFTEFFERVWAGDHPRPLDPLPRQREIVRSQASSRLERLAVSLLW